MRWCTRRPGPRSPAGASPSRLDPVRLRSHRPASYPAVKVDADAVDVLCGTAPGRPGRQCPVSGARMLAPWWSCRGCPAADEPCGSRPDGLGSPFCPVKQSYAIVDVGRDLTARPPADVGAGPRVLARVSPPATNARIHGRNRGTICAWDRRYMYIVLVCSHIARVITSGATPAENRLSSTWEEDDTPAFMRPGSPGGSLGPASSAQAAARDGAMCAEINPHPLYVHCPPARRVSAGT